MSIYEFLPYLIALLIAAAIPGPGITASVGKALGTGFTPAFYFASGIVLGDLTYLTLAILGLSAIASIFAGFFTFVKFAGAAYLAWLAWTFWQAGIDLEKIDTPKGRGFWHSLIGGYMLTLGNPKTIIFYMALLPTVVNLETVTFQRYLILALLTILALYAIIIPYIALAARARTFLRNPKAVRLLNRGAATAMLGAAAFIVTRE